MVLYGTNSGKVPPIDPMHLADSGLLFFTRPRLADYVPGALRRRAKDVFQALLAGTLSVSTLAEAHRQLDSRSGSRSGGRCCASIPQSTSLTGATPLRIRLPRALPRMKAP
jgi:hypothetical protein